ncbi:hypothetical protein GCM10010277_76880 [Streptomyces longisporoflavus]|nr:hypothetical protein GCM10010277_76880 [Streptomyces longisporoflavus]
MKSAIHWHSRLVGVKAKKVTGPCTTRAVRYVTPLRAKRHAQDDRQSRDWPGAARASRAGSRGDAKKPSRLLASPDTVSIMFPLRGAPEFRTPSPRQFYVESRLRPWHAVSVNSCSVAATPSYWRGSGARSWTS